MRVDAPLGSELPTPAGARHRRWSRRHLMQAALVALLAVSLYAIGRSVDWHATFQLLGRLGFLMPIVVVPYAGVLLCDSWGWRLTFERPAKISVRALFRVRAAAEAVANTLPAGAAASEALKAILLVRRVSVPLAQATANVVVSKFTLAISQALFLVLGLALASPTLKAASRQLIGRDGLESIALGVALAFLSLTCGLLFLVARGRLMSRLVEQLERIGPSRFRECLGSYRAAAVQVDDSLVAVSRLPKWQLARSVGLFLGGWTFLGIENWIMLHFLSPGLSGANAASIEAVVSMVRMLFFFIPSALGAQEAGYYGLLKVYGVPEAEVVAAAFMVTKRVRELAWVAVGYYELWTMGVPLSEAKRPGGLADAQ